MEYTNEDLVSLVFAELNRAESKFPGFPTDPIHAAAVLAEENGELQQAVLQWTYEGGGLDKVRKEAVQTAAMALRFLFHLRFMSCRPSEEKVVASVPTTPAMPGQEPANAGAMTSEELSKSLDEAHEAAKHSKLRFGPGVSA